MAIADAEDVDRGVYDREAGDVRVGQPEPEELGLVDGGARVAADAVPVRLAVAVDDAAGPADDPDVAAGDGDERGGAAGARRGREGGGADELDRGASAKVEVEGLVDGDLHVLDGDFGAAPQGGAELRVRGDGATSLGERELGRAQEEGVEEQHGESRRKE